MKFANVSGSSYAAGIVGKNAGTVSTDGTVGNVRIALCMMYGNVTNATNISPVYCGNHVNNVKNYTEYNYWRYRSGLVFTVFNDQLPVEKDVYLTRFPFFRHILNSHRELAAYFLFGGVSCIQNSNNNSNNPGTVNMTAKIDHARIYRFFGGGTTSKARITGNINVTIDNSFIDFYCGGPEFGDMETASNKTVITTANDTRFREYYGAGFGGTATTYTNDEDKNINLSENVNNIMDYPSNFFGRHYLDPAANVGRLDYKTGYGIGNCYKFEYIMHSRGHQVVARFYTGYAMFSLAKTGSVTNTLTNCIVDGSFYGGGCQGTVDGTVNSTLTGCTIHKSAFGGGYKAESNEVKVYPITPVSPLSSYYCETGVFSKFGEFPTPETFKWVQGTQEHHNEADLTDPDVPKLYTGTDVTMSDLGNVIGDITIILDGNTIVMDNVFGGGNESKSLSDATVIIKGTTEVKQNVFGGGNKAFVGINTTGTPGNTTVKLQESAKILGNVYGGGNEGPVGGDSKVIIEDEHVP